PIPNLLSELAPTSVTHRAERSAEPSLRANLSALPQLQRPNRLLEAVRDEAASVLGIEAEELRLRAGFAEQGMDSLMAVELANRLGRMLDVALPSTFLFEFPTLESLSKHLLAQVCPSEDESVLPQKPQSEPQADVEA